MPAEILLVPPSHVYDMSAKHLARTNVEKRHNYFGHLDANGQGLYSEGWRFPIVESHYDTTTPNSIVEWNEVTFVYIAQDPLAPPQSISVFGSFEDTREPIQLSRQENSKYWAVTLKLPTRQVYEYLFIVDGEMELDPVNTRQRLDSTKHNPRPQDSDTKWSFFWTDYCKRLVSLETWEMLILQRLTRHILPFNSYESINFLKKLDPSKLGGSVNNLYRFDLDIGAANYIDKILSGAERHHLEGYRTCIEIIDTILRSRNPYQEPRSMPEDMYTQLYTEMASGNVPGWDYSRYSNPSYFLSLLRRHTFTGAFSHPKYGGNGGAMGWHYLSEQFPPFDWGGGQESPWGTSPEYKG